MPDDSTAPHQPLEAIERLLNSAKSAHFATAFGNPLFDAAFTRLPLIVPEGFAPLQAAQEVSVALRCLKISARELTKEMKTLRKRFPGSEQSRTSNHHTKQTEHSQNSTASNTTFERALCYAKRVEHLQTTHTIDEQTSTALLVHAVPQRKDNPTTTSSTPLRRLDTLAHLPSEYFTCSVPALYTEGPHSNEAVVGVVAIGQQEDWCDVEIFPRSCKVVAKILGCEVEEEEEEEEEEEQEGNTEAAAGNNGTEGALIDADGGDAMQVDLETPEVLPVHPVYTNAGGVFSKFAQLAYDRGQGEAANQLEKTKCASETVQVTSEDAARIIRNTVRRGAVEKAKRVVGPQTHQHQFTLSVVTPRVVEVKRPVKRGCVRLRHLAQQSCLDGVCTAQQNEPPGRISLLPESPGEVCQDGSFSALLSYQNGVYGALSDSDAFRRAILNEDMEHLCGDFAKAQECTVVHTSIEVDEAEVEEAGGGGGDGDAPPQVGQKRKLGELLQEQLAASVRVIVAGRRRFNISKVGVILADLFAKGEEEGGGGGGGEGGVCLEDVYGKAKQDSTVAVTPQVIFAALVQHVHQSNVRDKTDMSLKQCGDTVVVTRG